MKKQTTVPEVKHSKLPWKLDGDKRIIVADVDVAKIYAMNENGKEDAEFIVKAVNNHYQLLEALKDAYASLEKSRIKGTWGNDDLAALNKAQQAIKNAEL